MPTAKTKVITIDKKTYMFKLRQVFAKYDETDIEEFYKIVEVGYEQEEAMSLIDTEGWRHHYTAEQVADKLMLNEWGNSTEAEFQKRKERIEYLAHREEQAQPPKIGTATVTLSADISDFETKMDRAIAKLKEFIALSEKAQEYK